MQHFIFYKNSQISFSSTGKGSAVVLLHGFLENSSMWNEVAEKMRKHHRVICIDLLGHGQSECVGYIHSMEMMAEAVEAVLKHLRIRKSILVGHSLGGYVALAFAEKHPEKIKSLCLMNSTSKADDEERKMLRTRANKMVQTNFEAMVRMSFSNLFSVSSRTLYKAEMDSAITEALKTSIQGYMAGQEGMKLRPNRAAVLVHSSFKKLYIIGKEDPVLDSEELIEEAIKNNAEYIVLPNGHMSHIENKKPLIEALNVFVKSC